MSESYVCKNTIERAITFKKLYFTNTLGSHITRDQTSYCRDFAHNALKNAQKTACCQLLKKLNVSRNALLNNKLIYEIFS